jgi:TolB-like protein
VTDTAESPSSLAASESSGSEASPVNPASIAVLPFDDLSPDGDQQYFSDGIAEEILNVLVRIDGLAVASRTSAFRFRDPTELGIPGIARALDVRHVLEGSVRKAGDTIRVTAQLIDGNTDKHLWSETYDQSLSAENLFAIQDEIAQAIVDALRDALGLQIDGEVRVVSDTENLDAYEIYLRARELFRDRSNLPESFALLERAVELDPGFARAWEGMAAVGAVIEDWGFVDRPYLEMAADAADRALAIDPGLSMPWAVRAQLESVRQPTDFAEALRLSERALEADPNNATALLWQSILWMNLGFFERALVKQDRCLEIDPAYENCRRFKALTLLFAGRSDEALEAFLAGVENGFVINRAPSFIRPLLDDNQLAMAMMLMAADDLPPEWQRAMLTFHETGRPAEDVREAVAASPDLRKFDAMHYLVLGAYGLAAEIETLSESTLAFWDPSLPGLRGSEPFKRMLRKDGVPDYWRTHEYPPQCRPIIGPNGEDDFECD